MWRISSHGVSLHQPRESSLYGNNSQRLIGDKVKAVQLNVTSSGAIHFAFPGLTAVENIIESGLGVASKVKPCLIVPIRNEQ